MPDGDRLHPGLGLSYQLPYRRLCEGFMRPDEQARGIADRIKRDITRGQCDLVPALHAVIARLEMLSDVAREHGRAGIDWQGECFNLRKAALNACNGQAERTASAFPRGVAKRNYEIVLRAAQDMLNDVEEGCAPPNARETLCQRFIQRFYQAQFGDAAPVLEEHFNQVDSASVREQLQRLDPHLNSQFDHLAQQLARHQDGESLRLRLKPRKREKIQDLDADIMDVFE